MYKVGDKVVIIGRVGVIVDEQYTLVGPQKMLIWNKYKVRIDDNETWYKINEMTPYIEPNTIKGISLNISY